MTERVMTTGQVAQVFSVNINTVIKWFDDGKLEGFRLPESNERRIYRDSVRAFMTAHGIAEDLLTAFDATHVVKKRGRKPGGASAARPNATAAAGAPPAAARAELQRGALSAATATAAATGPASGPQLADTGQPLRHRAEHDAPAERAGQAGDADNTQRTVCAVGRWVLLVRGVASGGAARRWVARQRAHADSAAMPAVAA
jgi:excisionase family DNA binding protein